MGALQPLTAEEQEMAAQYLYLVDQFLNSRHLCRAEYYDVVIFGYLKAIQRACRNKSRPEDRKNFFGLAKVCMRCSLYEEQRFLHQEKREADRTGISLDGALPCRGGEEISLHEAIPCKNVCVEDMILARDLADRALAVATPREREAIVYACLGFQVHEIAAQMGISRYTASRTLCNFRAKARAVAEDREVICCPQWVRDREKIQARNRAFHEAHREEINARRRAERAAKRAAEQRMAEGKSRP